MAEFKPISTDPRFLDETGKRYGHWTVLGFVGKGKWLCRCDCGRECEVFGMNLRGHKSSQCWRCQRNLRITHGNSRNYSKSPTYSTWCAMLNRCYCKNTRYYKYYGAIGVKVCERWMGVKGFENFLSDMGERPDNLTIDRFPNPSGDYEPGNCRWATRKQQRHNWRKPYERLLG